MLAFSDQPDKQWNYLFGVEGQGLRGFGVEYLSPLKSVVIGAEINAELDNVNAIHLSDTLESAILYDVVEHSGGYTLLYGHVVPVNQFPFHVLGLIEVNNNLEIVRQQEFDQFPEIYQWVPSPNRYRLCMTSDGDYAIVGNNVTWLSQEDWSVMGQSNTEFLFNLDYSNMGYYLGGVLPADDGQRVLISLSSYEGGGNPNVFEAVNDVGVFSVDMGESAEELFSFGRVDTNDSPPLKGFIAVEDGFLLAAQSHTFWYIWQDKENTGDDWPTNTLLTKLNMEMEPEWEVSLIDEHQTVVRGVAQDSEAGILLYGQRKHLDPSQYYAHFVLLPNNPVGIHEKTSGNHPVTCFPNPTKGVFKLRAEARKIGLVSIYDLTGNMVYSENIHRLEAVLNLSHLNSGSYLLTVKSESHKSQQRIVILD